jgi:hypothetical protein
MIQSIATLLVLLWTLSPIDSVQDRVEDSLTDLQSQLKFLAQQLQTCQGNTPSNVFDMKLHMLDKNTTCNDGSPAGYESLRFLNHISLLKEILFNFLPLKSYLLSKFSSGKAVKIFLFLIICLAQCRPSLYVAAGKKKAKDVIRVAHYIGVTP